MGEHVCPIRNAANGMINRRWCFDNMADVLADMPPIVSEDDMLRSELVLCSEGRLTVRYCPFDYVNPEAEVVIVGITPGLRQMFVSCREAQRAIDAGATGDDVLRRAGRVGSFGGSMRANLIGMLDGIGLNERLEIATTKSLFDDHTELLHSTSAILYPAFLDGKNYGGSPAADTMPLTRGFIDQVLSAELAMVGDALIIPLGKAVAAILRREVDRGAIRPENCLFEFPHPSGANAHRARQYEQHRRELTAQVSRWNKTPR